MLCVQNPLSHSLGECCLDVKSSGFCWPNVVRNQRGKAKKAVFLWLYQESDLEGRISLDATRIGEDTGLSRRSIYNAIEFLRRVNLLRLVRLRRGRGRHSLYQLTWMKPESSTAVERRKERQQKAVSTSSSERKCAALSKDKNHKNHISYDRPRQIERPQRIQNQWNRKMRAFRELVERSWLMPKEQQLCVSLVGRFIKNKSVEFARALYDKLAGIAHKVDAPNWVLSTQDLCRWFMGMLKGLAKGMEVGLQT